MKLKLMNRFCKKASKQMFKTLKYVNCRSANEAKNVNQAFIMSVVVHISYDS